MTARETFEEAARTARRLVTLETELNAMAQAWRRGEWLGSGTKGWHGDPTAAQAGYRMRRSEALERERESLTATVDEARTLARGVGELLGASYRDALTLRYMEGNQWQQVADRLGVSVSTAHNRVSASFDLIDGLGSARVRQARGVAEDR